MKIHIEKGFGAAPNHLLSDKNISWKAKGLYSYIQSKPDDWDFAIERMEGSDGKHSTSSGVKELEKNGYLERKKTKNEKGFFEYEYFLYWNPKIENPRSENLTSDNQTPIKEIDSNKDIVINNNIYNKEKNNKKENNKFGNTELLENESFGNTEQLKQETIPVVEKNIQDQEVILKNDHIPQTSEMMVVGNPDIPLKKKGFQEEIEVIKEIQKIYDSYGFTFKPGDKSVFIMKHWLNEQRNIDLANKHSKTPKELLLGAIKCKFGIQQGLQGFVKWNTTVSKLIGSFEGIYNEIRGYFEKEKIIQERKNIVFGR